MAHAMRRLGNLEARPVGAPAGERAALDVESERVWLSLGEQSRAECLSAWALGNGRYLVRTEEGGASKAYELERPDSDGSSEEGLQLHTALQALLPEAQAQQRAAANGAAAPPPNAGRGGPASTSAPGASDFARRTEEASAAMYFHYYGMLQHQQNMLQDYVRTGGYWLALLENRADFEGKTVMDVGAGTGILSLFAVQAGAAKVYAVEASEMAGFCQTLLDANPELGARVEVVRGRLEEVALDVRVDVLVSEPMGTLLVNERMLETYIYARRRFLKPGGLMFPSTGRIYAAPFTDEALYNEVVAKALFWNQAAYYGVSLQALWAPALSSYLSQIVVDEVNANVLVAPAASHDIDFRTANEADLLDIRIPLAFKAGWQCQVHGIACWFDVTFAGSTHPRCLSTAPTQPVTHWFQLRCLLEKPLVALQGCDLRGELRLRAHERQSYTCHLSLEGPALVLGGRPQQRRQTADLKEPYYRQLNAWSQYQLNPAAVVAGTASAPPPQPVPEAPAGFGEPHGGPLGALPQDSLQAEAEELLEATYQPQPQPPAAGAGGVRPPAWGWAAGQAAGAGGEPP